MTRKLTRYEFAKAILAVCIGFCLTAGTSAQIVATSTDLADNTMIPDDGPGSDGIVSIINIMENEIIKDISVTVNDLQHSSLGDLTIELRYLGPVTTNNFGTAPLLDRVGVEGTGLPGDKSNLDGNYSFTSNFGTDPDISFWSEAANTPEDEVVNPDIDYFASDDTGNFFDIGDFFAGNSTFGQWELRIADLNDLGNEIGSVDSFTINFESNAVPEPSTAAILCLAGLGLATRRRR